MDDVKITGIVDNDVQVPNSRKHSTNKENIFVYNVDGQFNKGAMQSIKNTIEAHAIKNGFTARVTFNTKL